jgi:hypothetical protein
MWIKKLVFNNAYFEGVGATFFGNLVLVPLDFFGQICPGSCFFLFRSSTLKLLKMELYPFKYFIDIIPVVGEAGDFVLSAKLAA